MKKIFSIIILATLVFTSCHYTPSEVSEDILPKGDATDLTCDINIMESATAVKDLTEEEATDYLLAHEWIKSETYVSKEIRTFLCKDSTLIRNLRGQWVVAPRTTLSLIIDNGRVKRTNILTQMMPSEHPIRHLAEWDAWIYRNWRKSGAWTASIGEFGNIIHRYNEYATGEHEAFYKYIKDIDDLNVLSLEIKYAGEHSIFLSATREGMDDEQLKLIYRVNVNCF